MSRSKSNRLRQSKRLPPSMKNAVNRKSYHSDPFSVNLRNTDPPSLTVDHFVMQKVRVPVNLTSAASSNITTTAISPVVSGLDGIQVYTIMDFTFYGSTTSRLTVSVQESGLSTTRVFRDLGVPGSRRAAIRVINSSIGTSSYFTPDAASTVATIADASASTGSPQIVYVDLLLKCKLKLPTVTEF